MSPLLVHPEQGIETEAHGLELLSPAEMEALLKTARTIAVLGIKPESRAHLDAHQIPLYLQKVGYRILPVPTRYPEVTHILGVPARRRLTELPPPVDVLNVFCKPADFLTHLDGALTLRPSVVWFQFGLIEPSAARRLLGAGIPVAEDCIGCRRASMWPSVEPFDAQRGSGA
ncbi:CoA-binding protein [Polyangium sp. y55x31]|uniref:CoA-binding protein n=1 Tax=Polyangium sp. y55x31 TaxID=3042688 RepID=UPI0024824463|nr:CoA-binding protein [Polyangium sp. y55x31]MDI1480379.1 CoA-binding protein [Polyangium sp. y55x31]